MRFISAADPFLKSARYLFNPELKESTSWNELEGSAKIQGPTNNISICLTVQVFSCVLVLEIQHYNSVLERNYRTFTSLPSFTTYGISSSDLDCDHWLLITAALDNSCILNQITDQSQAGVMSGGRRMDRILLEAVAELPGYISGKCK